MNNALPEAACYHDDLAREWRRGYARGSFAKRLSFIRKHLQCLVKDGQCWLDAGCGSGVLTDEIAVLGARGHAIDASERMIEEAGRTADRSRLAFQFEVLPTLECLPFPDRSFDGVLCSSVVEYLARPAFAFQEFHRVLRPEGCVFLSVAHRYSAIRGVQRIMRKAAHTMGTDVYSYLGFLRASYDVEGISRELAESGFSVENVQFFDPMLPQLVWPVAPPALIFVTGRRV